MKVGDLVFRRKRDVLDNLHHISDYCYDSDGSLVNLEDSIGVIISIGRRGQSPVDEQFIEVAWATLDELHANAEFENQNPPEFVWVAWSPEVSSLERVENLKVLDEDDLDPFAEDETDG